MSQNLSDLILFTSCLLGRELEEWEKERIVIINARQNGKSTTIKNIIEERERAIMNAQVQPRRCDCLKCRMGKPDQCTTYSPRKRGRK